MKPKERKQAKKSHPKNNSCFLSQFLFCWELPILFKSRTHIFTVNNLYEPVSDHRATNLGNKLEKFWKEEENLQKCPSLKRALTKTFGLEFVLCGCLILAFDLGIMLLQPFCLRKFLSCLAEEQCVEQKIYLVALSLSLISLSQTLYFHWFYLKLSTLGMKMRVACSSLIYRKCLKLKIHSCEKNVVGKVVNLLTNDVDKFNEVAMFSHYLWTTPVKIVIYVFYIYVMLGPTSLTGLAVVVFHLVVQWNMSLQIFFSKREVAAKTDDRIRLINDIVGGIQTIKMYAWEKSFSQLVTTARESEMIILTKANSLIISNNTIKMYITKLALFLCILSAVLSNFALSPEYIFPLMSIYESLTLVGLVRLQMALVHWAEGRNSIRRIQDFLLSGNKSIPLIKSPISDDTNGSESYQIWKARTVNAIHLNKVNVNLASKQILRNITFSALPGELVGISGVSGSGKSVLLQVILKEIEVVGLVSVGRKISYASQEAWIFSASIKQNILFGEKEDEEKYFKVIRVCALEHDVSLFASGDQTLVGERGVMLSGGQKARINLARAVYRDADVYLLDDPLSAVDVNVAQHIFNQCILGYLKEKCVVLVTHHVKFLKSANKRYIIDRGELIEDVLTEYDLKPVETRVQEAVLKPFSLPQEIQESAVSKYSTSHIYKKYCFFGRNWFMPCLIITLLLLTQCLTNVIDFLIISPVILDDETKKSSFFSLIREYFLYVYAGLILCLFIFNHSLSLIFIKHFMAASKSLHNVLSDKILTLPVEFFNEHPPGRILNRFAEDIGRIDAIIPIYFYEVVRTIFTGIGIVTIVVILNYWLILPTLVMIVLLYLYSWLFQPLNRNLGKLEGITKSPILTYAVTSLRGLSTIRASDKQKYLIQEFEDHLDTHSCVFYLFKSLLCTITFWIDLMCVVYSTVVIFSFVISDRDSLPGYVGLAVSQANILVGLVQFGMKMYSELNTTMTAVERVLEYSDLPEEQDDGDFIPPASWPQFGEIEFKSVSMRYSPDKPLVLQNIDIKIHSGEKVGIVGRTGAGKSSLVSVLFHLFHFEGRVLIDDIDTKTLPLNVLRSKISIIPQDPVLFVGPLRKNLDPFDEFNDSQIWNALDATNLKSFVANLSTGLQTHVNEGGTNFSVGQKQLLCLTRAMLKNANIFVFDEATANVDLQTDELIQTTVRQKFKDCTILMIAHRLDTVMDSDKVLVMDNGRVLEFGTPEELLRNQSGLFHQLVYENGNRDRQNVWSSDVYKC